MENRTIEQEVYEMISGKSYPLFIGDEQITFRYACLDDLQLISSMVSVLPKYDEIDTAENINADLPQLIDSFKYANKIAEIIILTVEGDKEEKERVYNIVKKNLNAVEIYALVQQVMKNNHLFFYKNTITFLRGMNQLKPTKGIIPTAHI